MLLDTFNKLCAELGDQSYDESERWKSIKSISTEGQMEPIDFDFKLASNNVVNTVLIINNSLLS